MKTTNSFIITKTSAKYRITRDAYQFILEKARKNGDFTLVGYYHSIKGIFEKLFSLEVISNAEHGKLTETVEKTAQKLEKAVLHAITIAEKGSTSEIEAPISHDLS